MLTHGQAHVVHSGKSDVNLRSTPYTPVNSTKGEFRLMDLLPGKYEAAIEIHLHTIALSKIPTYEALSYAWGSEVSRHSVIADGVPVIITDNLDCALRHIRLDSAVRTLWVDALCINQEDVQERSLQVRLMGTIYSAAHQVIIWLGPAEDYTKDQYCDFQTMMGCMKSEIIPKEVNEQVTLIKTLSYVLHKPWFNRLWVVQELTLARHDPMVYLGNYVISWSQFVAYISGPALDLSNRHWSFHTDKRSDLILRRITSSVFKDKSKQVQHLSGIRDTFHRDHGNQSICRLAYLLHGTRQSFASNPRDKIYGVLGIAPSLAISIDYSLPVERVFAEAMSILIQRSFANAFHLRPLRQPRPCYVYQHFDTTPNLPSWVYEFEWYLPTPSDNRDLIGYHTTLAPLHKFIQDLVDNSRGIAPAARFSSDYLKLHTIGAPIGTIAVTSSASLGSLLETKNVQEGVLAEIYRTMVEPGGLSIDSLFEALIGVQEERSRIEIPLNQEWRTAFLQIVTQPEELDMTPGSIHSEMVPLLLQASGRTLFVTEEGHIGLSYHQDLVNGIRPGDLVVGLFGVNFPFILRPVATGHEMINVAHIASHKWGHDFAEQDELSQDWKELEKFGLFEYTIV